MIIFNLLSTWASGVIWRVIFCFPFVRNLWRQNNALFFNLRLSFHSLTDGNHIGKKALQILSRLTRYFKVLPLVLHNVLFFLFRNVFKFLKFHLTFLFFVLFISDNNDVFMLNIVLYFLEPVFKAVLERLFVQIIQKKNYVWTFQVLGDHRPVFLLSCTVPKLKSKNAWIDLHVFESEINANCRIYIFIKLIVDYAFDERAFTDVSIPK